MSLLKRVLLSAAVASSMSATPLMIDPALASGEQTLARCVKELNTAYPYQVGSDTFYKHVQVCVKTLTSQPAVESLGQCVAGLNAIYPYQVGSDANNRHIEACSGLLQAQQSNQNQQVQPQGVILVPVPSGGMQSVPSGNPEAIARCMNSLLYRIEEQKPFPGWVCVANDVNCKTVRVRTEMSEATAAQACQNAR